MQLFLIVLQRPSGLETILYAALQPIYHLQKTRLLLNNYQEIGYILTSFSNFPVHFTNDYFTIYEVVTNSTATLINYANTSS